MKSIDKLKLAFIDADIKTFGDTKPYDGWEQSAKYISERSALIKKRSSRFFGLLSEPWKKTAAAAVLVIAAVVAFVIFKNGFGNERRNGSFSYQVLEDRTLEITSYTGDSEDVTVPEKIDGGFVTKIKSMSSNASMKSVTLPETLTVIESNAFKGCKYLSVVSIPKSVGVIGSGAFEGCDSLKTVYFSGTDAEWKMIEISNGNIELYSAEMRFFNETTLPLPVTSQAEVSSCSEIPSETKTRPSFSEAKHTDAVTVSKAETTELSDKSVIMLNGIIYRYNDRDDSYYVSGYEGRIKNVEIPSMLEGKPVTGIAKEAFKNSGLRKITLPESIRSIGEKAFSRCKYVKEIKLSDGIEKIGDRVFEYCESLIGIALPDSVKYIGEGLFSSCNALRDVRLPSGLSEIKPYTFDGCAALIGFAFPEKTEVIGDASFRNCSSIKDLKLPESLTKLGKSAFSGCGSIEMIEIPSGVDYVGASAFTGCKKLVSAVLPSTIETLPENIFNGCISLTEFIIPSGVTEIGAKAFYNCDGLVSVKLPKALKKLGDMAFASCDKIMQITIPINVNEIGNGVFADCSSMLWFFVDEFNASYKSQGNCIIKISTGTLIQACDNSTIPDDGTVSCIGSYAFSSCDFYEIIVPDGVKKISESAFNNCNNLYKITFPDSVEYLDPGSLTKCTYLNEICFGGVSEKWGPVAAKMKFDGHSTPRFYYSDK